MDFIKKNYEKVLLGLVLFGLIAAVVFLPFLVTHERERLQDLSNTIINSRVEPLAPPNIESAEIMLKRMQLPLVIDISNDTNKLFNPVRWQKTPDGRLVKNPAGRELEKLEITDITPLYLRVTLDSVSVSDLGVRYIIGVERQAAEQANQRGKRSVYTSPGEKEELFTVKEVKGPKENPTAIVLEWNDSGEQISISKAHPFQRVEGYMADLKYPPEGRVFQNRRVGDRIVVANDQYKIVAITKNEVVLSAESNQKKWTKKYNAAGNTR